MIRSLIINPGSTSTKIAVFEELKPVFQKSLSHSAEQLAPYKKVAEQFEFRRDIIVQALKEANILMSSIHVIMARGGLVHPVESGIYRVSPRMVVDLKQAVNGEHASNLGAIIADDLGKDFSIPVYIADPVVVDELQEVARISGHPNFIRRSIFHALNHKAIARRHCEKEKMDYQKVNLIIIHLGGGISVGAHRYGKVVDVNDALTGEGPFSPERSGTLTAGQLVDECFSGKYSSAEMHAMICGNGGYKAYLGTNSAQEVEQRIAQHDDKALLIRNAMAYQIAKEAGAMSAVLHGRVDGIIFTGGMAHNQDFVEKISTYISFIAPIFVYPGEDEMTALAENAITIMSNQRLAKDYR